MTVYDEERVAQLLRLLPPAPEGWVHAAQELPAARRTAESLVARAEADVALRERLIADLEAAVTAEGYDASTQLIGELRRMLAAE